MRVFKIIIRVIIWLCGLVAQTLGTYIVYTEYGLWTAVGFFFIGGLAISFVMYGINKILGTAED